MNPGARIGVDIGGTFTDLMLCTAAGAVHTGKLLTTPDDPARAILDGVARLLRDAALPPGAVAEVLHATTLVTNAILARRGARAALLTTRGFRDVLETGTETRHDVYDLFLERPQPLIPRALRFEVTERLDAAGQVVLPLDEAELAALAPRLREAGVAALAIGFLHSPVAPAQEARAGAVMARLLPGLAITCSATLVPEAGEYARFSTAAANAYVQPLVADYLSALRRRLAAAGMAVPVHVMLSHGGLATPETAAAEPVRMLESGPAAGAIAAAAVARQAGLARALGFDMGGTTAKLCLIQDGRPAIDSGFEAARVARLRAGSGLPIRVPSVALVEIGAGGGSIARVDGLGLLRVGPESAGAVPGPACYGQGGLDPTVTDAALLLGWLDPARFLGGAMPLDAAAAAAAMRRVVADPLGLSVTEAAMAVVRLAAEAMAAAARTHAAERGEDPASATLVAFGGAGPLFAALLARRLGITRILVPDSAGVMSAAGLLAARPVVELVQALPTGTSEAQTAVLDDGFATLATAAAAALGRLGADAALAQEERRCEVHAEGHGTSLTLALPDGHAPAAIHAAFRAAHHRLFGLEVAPGRLVVTALRLRAAVSEAPLPPAPLDAARMAPAIRPAWFEDAGWQETAVLDRAALGAARRGPCIIAESGCTVLVPAGWTIEALASGGLAMAS